MLQLKNGYAFMWWRKAISGKERRLNKERHNAFGGRLKPDLHKGFEWTNSWNSNFKAIA